MGEHDHGMHDLDEFPTDPSGQPVAIATPSVDVAPGGSFDLRIHPVAKQIGRMTYRMLSYNGSIPGPTLRVRQDSEISVHVVNETEMDTTVHWHGLRLENEYDGVPHDTQVPIAPGGEYTHRLTFPDAGLFWYHPHMREDYAQDMGLYGNIIVEPTDPDYWPKVDREYVLTLDDILIEDDKISSFDPHHATFTAMGRFGNVLLTGGETDQHLDAKTGEVVRLWLTNTANTRVFKLRIPGTRMKLVGNDGGRYEKEAWIDDVVVAPSERAIVDVLFAQTGEFSLEHVTPERTYLLATISVSAGGGPSAAVSEFENLRVNDDMTQIREKTARFWEAEPDKTLALIAEMYFEEPTPAAGVIYTCPMHPEVIRAEDGHCPQCGMKLRPTVGITKPVAVESHHEGQDHHRDSTSDGIEWEDDMLELNRTTTPANMKWKLVDRDTGDENAAIDWVFDEGEEVKIRLVNEVDSDHPMHHPFHVHGERFLVLARNEVPEDNLVWKDTVLLRTGEVVDIFLDASNPGLWMAHCHIAEHMESGMMFSFRVRSAS